MARQPVIRPLMTTNRFETFSDGVIAIAITLLVLDLPVHPKPINGSLLRGMVHEWPTFAAYAVSFFTIGIFWINHHLFFRYVKAVDHGVMLLNLLLLMWVTLWPFTTSVLAANIREPVHQHGAAVLYVAAFLGMAFTWAPMYPYLRRHDLIDRIPSPGHARYLRVRNTLGAVGYLIALIVALFSAMAALAICGLTTAYYMLPSHEDPEFAGRP